MHEAYESAPILEKLPLQIESIACYSDTLLVGTKQGHLLVYTVRPHATAEKSRFEVALERSNKSFSKKPITQLAVVPEYHILISLSDGIINVHDLTVYAQIATIPKAKGASLFAIDVQKQESLSGETQYNLRICVAVKRRLQLYYYKNRDFKELRPDLGVPDVPKTMAWCGDSLCLGFKRDYFLVKTNGGDLKDLFPTGKQLEPTVTRLSNNRLALGRDEMSILIDSDGNPTQSYPLTWSDVPRVVVHDPPYVIAILPRYVEIRTIEPKLLIQSIELDRPRFVCSGGGFLYIASTLNVWRLGTAPVKKQIKQLLASQQFELALHLAELSDDQTDEKSQSVQHIRTLYAFNLFCQHRFTDALQIFAELKTDPSHVIGLYPNLLPQDFRNQLEYPDKLPSLEGAELEKGLVALIAYLTQKRHDFSKIDANTEIISTAIIEGNSTIKSKKQISQILDTTLLKCYIKTNDALVASLLRLKDNNCHIEESERALKKHHKYSELIILYEQKGEHRKALELLLKQCHRPNSSLKGHDRTISYLQRLGSEHLDLIFEYAEWVLRDYPDDGLKIFTEDIHEVEMLPREAIFEYLERTARDLIIPYLEHVIWVWEDETPLFHNVLALQYKEKVMDLMDSYMSTLPSDKQPVKAGSEPGELGTLRHKLITFLQMSQFYVPERLLAHFPFNSFFEERAILLGRLGRHEQALAIYVHVLNDRIMALDYCQRNYHAEKEGNKEVFFLLYKMYLQPPDTSTLGVISAYHDISADLQQPNVEAALKILEEHSNKLDTVKALDLLPVNTSVNEVLVFLESVLEDRAARKRSAQVLKSLLCSESMQVQEERMFHHKVKCTITEEKICRVCKKRIGNSAFARYPNGVIVHYFCCKDVKVCPVELPM